MSTEDTGVDHADPGQWSPEKSAEFIRLQQLVARGKAGDRSVIGELNEALDENSTLWKIAGDLYLNSVASWVKRIAGEDMFFQQSLFRTVDELGRALAEEEDGPPEQLLVQQVVLAWLQLGYAENRSAQTNEESVTIQRFLEQSLDRANRRHLKAITTLKNVRRLRPKKPNSKAVSTASHNNRDSVKVEPWAPYPRDTITNRLNRFTGLEPLVVGAAVENHEGTDVLNDLQARSAAAMIPAQSGVTSNHSSKGTIECT
jgi:hypothetical protein